MPFAATRMDLESILPREVSLAEKDKCTTYMWNLKNDANEIIYKVETDSQT